MPRTKTTTSAETIRQKLADDILNGVFAPGTRLDENGLAKLGKLESATYTTAAEIEPQLRLPMIGVLPMTVIAVLRQDRPDISIEIPALRFRTCREGGPHQEQADKLLQVKEKEIMQV